MYAKSKSTNEEDMYRFYIATAAQNINKILADTFAGSYLKLSYYDILHPKEETRTADEIISGIKEKLKGLE